MLDALTQQLQAGTSLDRDQVQNAVEALVREDLDAEAKADFLCALADKGETPEEIAAFALRLRDKSVPVPIEESVRREGLLDVVGTGGDRSGTFNISTAAALLAAAVGVRVTKHGNRAVTSQAGSADVLEALGLTVELAPTDAARQLRDHSFTFLFAPRYHPAFRNIGPARKLCAARGRRTIFNYLGPLLNPARPDTQLVGVPRPQLCEPIAHVLQTLGVRRCMVVCGLIASSNPPMFIDELSVSGKTTVAEFYQERGFSLSEFSSLGVGLRQAALADLSGGTKEVNARILEAILTGHERGSKRDAVLLNAGAALFVAEKERSVTEGVEAAARAIDSGRAGEWLQTLRHATASQTR